MPLLRYAVNNSLHVYIKIDVSWVLKVVSQMDWGEWGLMKISTADIIKIIIILMFSYVLVFVISAQDLDIVVSSQADDGFVIEADKNSNQQPDSMEAGFEDPSSFVFSENSEIARNNDDDENSDNVRDYDSDGIPDNSDPCPILSGRGDQYGGANSTTGCPLDSDDDDIIDNIDHCPWHMGKPEDEGCPISDVIEETPTEEPITLVYLTSDGVCQIATQNTERVNIRRYPHESAEVNYSMSPEYGYQIFGTQEIDGQVWYMIEDGWVASWVTRSGGNCDDIPQLSDVLLPDISTDKAS